MVLEWLHVYVQSYCDIACADIHYHAHVTKSHAMMHMRVVYKVNIAQTSCMQACMYISYTCVPRICSPVYASQIKYRSRTRIGTLIIKGTHLTAWEIVFLRRQNVYDDLSCSQMVCAWNPGQAHILSIWLEFIPEAKYLILKPSTLRKLHVLKHERIYVRYQVNQVCQPIIFLAICR